MGWNDVDRKTGGGRYLSIDPDSTVRVRLLDEEPYTVFVHKISQVVDGDETFISVPATPVPDDDYIDEQTNRFRAVPQYNMRCALYDDNGEIEGLYVLSGGPQIFRPLKNIHNRYSDVRQFDIEITRTGEKLKTSYDVSTAPDSHDPDIDTLIEQVEEDESLAWDTLFPPITPEEQKQMVERAKIDLSYDPVEEIMENMVLEDALDTHITFGKYGPDKYPPRGKKVGELIAIDSGYLEWAADEVTSDDEVAAACRIAVLHMHDQLENKAPTKKVTKGKTKKAKKEEPEENEVSEWPLKMDPADYLSQYGDDAKNSALAKEVLAAKGEEGEEGEEGEDEGDTSRTKLIDSINEVFSSDERFSDAMEIVNVIKEHGDGKTRVKDLTVEQLQSLLRDITTG